MTKKLPMSLLRLSQVSFHYGAKKVLEKIDLEIFPQEIVGILGSNGSGKSTLLKILNASLKPQSGQVFLKGKALHTYSKRSIAQHIASLSQDPQVDFPFSVREVVLMGRFPYLRAWAWENSQDMEIANSAMAQADCLHLAHKNVQELSGGEKERVYLARALAQKSEILLLDEPNTHLDLFHQSQLLKNLKQLKEEGKSLIVVFHDLNLAASLCQRIVLLAEHQILACGHPQEVLNPEKLHLTFGASPLQVQDPSSGQHYFLPKLDA